MGRLHAACSILFFMVCACTMMPLNKMTMHHFRKSPLTTVAGQMFGASALLVLVVAPLRIVVARCQRYWYPPTLKLYLSDSPTTTTPKWSLRDVQACLVLPPIFTIMLTSSMMSLRHASLGTVMAIRNMSPLVALPLEYWFLETAPNVTPWTVVSLLMVTLGCLLYVMNDLQTNALGILLTTVNMLCGVFDRLIQRHLLAEASVPKETLLLVNNTIGGILVMGLAIVRGEDVAGAVARSSALQCYLWGSSVVVGLLLGYSGAMAQSHVSATTHLLVANVNRLVVLVIGALVLGEVPTYRMMGAAGLSLLGTVLYAR